MDQVFICQEDCSQIIINIINILISILIIHHPRSLLRLAVMYSVLLVPMGLLLLLPIDMIQVVPCSLTPARSHLCPLPLLPPAVPQLIASEAENYAQRVADIRGTSLEIAYRLLYDDNGNAYPFNPSLLIPPRYEDPLSEKQRVAAVKGIFESISTDVKPLDPSQDFKHSLLPHQKIGLAWYNPSHLF